jgi:putative ABC transport system permease protein
MRGSIELGLIYGLMALGVYITFRVLNLPDLTVDGSFVLGMAVCAVATGAGRPFLALLLSALAGAAAGAATCLMQTKMGVQPILSGILTMTGLYSVNLFAMGGRSNISFFGKPGIFEVFASIGASKLAVCALAALLALSGCALFFKTKAGLALRATGDNEDMVRSSSINADASKLLGFSLSNALVALSGALLAQYQSSVDVGYGTGMVVTALASVVIGDALAGRGGVSAGLASSIGGAVAYRAILAYALKAELLPSYGVKLASAAIVLAAITAPKLKKRFKGKKP